MQYEKSPCRLHTVDLLCSSCVSCSLHEMHIRASDYKKFSCIIHMIVFFCNFKRWLVILYLTLWLLSTVPRGRQGHPLGKQSRALQ